MKKLLLATAAFAALSTAASAADLPRKSVAPVIAVPLFTWTGFYVGLNAGYAWNDSKLDVSGNPSPAAFGAPPFSFKGNPDGFIGGAQIGYNYQFNAIVVGIEADIQYSSIKKTFGVLGLPIIGGFQPNSISENASKMEWFGTIRGRLGFTPIDRLLIYATGGVIFADVKNNTRTHYNNQVGQTFNYVGSSGSSRTGYVVGGGLEYAFTNNLTAKLEYMYYDLGKTTHLSLPVAANPPFSLNTQVKTTGQLVRVGVNYKF
jgi:outer membrane immunogenic protein